MLLEICPGSIELEDFAVFAAREAFAALEVFAALAALRPDRGEGWEEDGILLILPADQLPHEGEEPASQQTCAIKFDLFLTSSGGRIGPAFRQARSRGLQ
jgi:hypothetical protein